MNPNSDHGNFHPIPFLIAIMFVLGIVACGKANGNKKVSKYSMTNEEVSQSVTRYSNDEVICYAYNGRAVSCKWKESN